MDNPRLSVTVNLDEIIPLTTPVISPLFPTRTLTLEAPDWSVKIGRSTSSSTGPRQAANNAWYSSRVISRDHAELKADPETREVLIRDCGSMHGTHVAGRRLKRGVTERLYEGDNILFGAEVARGDDTFLPVKVFVAFVWSDGYSSEEYGNTAARNYFTADYSEDEPEYYDSEGSVASNLEAAPEDRAYNNFSVPESDVSDDIVNIISDEDPLSDEESPTSSPIDSITHGMKLNQNKENQRPLRGHTNDDPINERLSPSLGAQQNDDSDGYTGEDSYYDDSSVFEVEEEVFDVIRKMDRTAPPDGFASLPPNSLRPGRAMSQPIALSPSPPLGRPARDPSPSDAAMVKQARQAQYPPFGETLPSIQPPEVHTSFPSYLSHAISSQPGRDSSAWAGHNSVLYDAVPLSAFGTTSPDQLHQSSGPDDFGWCAHRPTAANLPNFESPRYGYDLEAPSTSTAALTALNTAIGSGQKRKADQISEDNVLVPDSNKDASAQVAQDNAPIPTIDPADLQPIVVTETMESVKSPEPPKKKPKKHKHDSGARKNTNRSTFAKFATTAVASAAVGAVGTIWALVTLPKEYFT